VLSPFFQDLKEQAVQLQSQLEEYTQKVSEPEGIFSAPQQQHTCLVGMIP